MTSWNELTGHIEEQICWVLRRWYGTIENARVPFELFAWQCVRAKGVGSKVEANKLVKKRVDLVIPVKDIGVPYPRIVYDFRAIMRRRYWGLQKKARTEKYKCGSLGVECLRRLPRWIWMLTSHPRVVPQP